MISSQNNILLDLYASQNTVFTMTQIQLMYPTISPTALALRMNRCVRTGRLINLRKGIYAKPNYNPLELACSLYTPSYVSGEYILQRAGVVFQYDSAITMISYLGRELEIDSNTIIYHKIKGEIMIQQQGLVQKGNVTMATPERALLDMMYLNKNFYVDNAHILNKDLIAEILPIYNCKRLEQRVQKLLKDGFK